MENQKIIEATAKFAQKTLEGAEGGHDWFHIERVWKNAKHIGQDEGNVDMFVIELSALLHDIADSKFHGGDEEIGPKTARAFLISLSVDNDIIEHVENIVRHISFKGSLEGQTWSSPELAVVQDADRLDAIGAIGIARTFNYGGSKGRKLYDPSTPPNVNQTKAEYKASEAPTINHFYEKLLLLKDKMNTQAGKRIAANRHQYMEQFLEQFYKEWRGEA